ncbi:MAG TPA: hypothetical protein DEA08_06875 [Planctomycetes bacterium]|nr:hypothetical protein [Planctomycetota bacterium]
MPRQLARHLGPLGLTLSLCLLAGCNTGSRSSSSQTSAASTAQASSQTSTAATTSSSSAQPASQAPTTLSAWDKPYTAMPISTDGVQALYVLPSGELLTGSTAGVVERLDLATGAQVSETQLRSISSFAENGGSAYLATSNPFFMGGNLGQVYVRDAQGAWTLSLDHPLGGAIVAALGQEVYAFASEFGGGDGTLSVLDLATGQWTQDVVTFPGAQLTQTARFDNELWVAGSDNAAGGGKLRLYHGLNSTWTAVPGLPDSTTSVTQTEVATDLKTLDGELYLATAVVDTTTSQASAGALYRSADGQTWTAVKSYRNDAPVSLAWHRGELYVGLLSGGLERGAPASLVLDAAVPGNNGLLRLISLNDDVLIAGTRGTAGAELLRRTTTTAP